MQICLRFLQRRDRKRSRHWTLAQASDLRKNKPHPVARLASATQLFDGTLIRTAGVLGGHEAVQVVWIVHSYSRGEFGSYQPEGCRSRILRQAARNPDLARSGQGPA